MDLSEKGDLYNRKVNNKFDMGNTVEFYSHASFYRNDTSDHHKDFEEKHMEKSVTL